MQVPSSRAGRAVATATALLLVGLAAPSGAGAAANNGQATGTESVVSGTWSATAAAPSLTFTSDVSQTSTITNTGTIALSAISYTVTISDPISGSPTFRVFACPVAWVSGKCGGRRGTRAGGKLAKDSTTTVTSSVIPALGGSVYLQVEPTRVISPVTVTLAPTITSPIQLRAAVSSHQ